MRQICRCLVAVAGACLALPASSLASANDVRVRFTGAMESFYQPNEQPSNDEIVNIRKWAWDLYWDGTADQLDASSLGQPRVLLATGQTLSTFTDRAPCRATLAYVPMNGPYVLVVRREGDLDVANISTTWSSSFIDSTPSLACVDTSNGYSAGTLASNASWTPAQPLIDPSAPIEQQGVQHLGAAIFRFNRATPDTTIPFSFTYTAPSGTGGDPGMHKIVWFGRVQIQSDPQGMPKPVDLSARLPGSTGFGAPGNPPPATGISAVTGDMMLRVIDQAASDWLGSLTRRAFAAAVTPTVGGLTPRGFAAAATRTVTVPLSAPESWAEGGRLTVRLCLAGQRSRARTCSAAHSVASARANVRGTPTGGAGAPASAETTNPPLVFHTTAAVIRSVRAAKAVLFQATFTGAVTHRTVAAQHTFRRR